MRKRLLPVIETSQKTRTLVWSALAFALGYGALGMCPWTTPSFLPLTAVDTAVPFMPWTLAIYLSDYIFIALVLASLKNVEAFSLAFYRMIFGIMISFAVFLLFPTVYPRPSVAADPLWSETFLFLHFLDQPTNCFPSLHVSITLIAAASLPPLRLSLKRAAWIWALAICLSTLTTRQHYALDVAGGIIVAWISLGMTPRTKALKSPA